MTRARRTRSMRGVMVDFDLISIKEQMAAQPAPLEVRAREDFIDKRLRRRLKKPADSSLKPTRPQVSDISVTPAEEILTPPMPAAPEDQGELIDHVEDVPVITRQKAKK